MGKVRIISHSNKPFIDRVEAGTLLGKELQEHCGTHAVVLGIPRGGLIVARTLAGVLEAELDIVLSRKLGAPGNPELAIGAISENGKLFLNQMLVAQLGLTESFVEKAASSQMLEIVRRTAYYRTVRSKVTLKERVVILTDDGLATGATMQAALWSTRQEQPQKLIVTVPVGPVETVKKLAKDADELLCLRAPPEFFAVGNFYVHFEQTAEEEVLAILKKVQERRARE